MSFQSSPPINPAAEVFASATIEIIEPKSLRKTEKVVARELKNQKSSSLLHHKTRAYYRDSSGRARVHLRVRLTTVPTTTADDTTGSGDDDKNEDNSVGLEALIECGCIEPPPVESDGSTPNTEGNESKDKKEEDDDEEFMKNELSNIGKDMEESKEWYTDTTFAFECTCPSSSTSKSDVAWALEGVTILHSQIERADQKKKKIAALLFDVEVAVRGNGIIRVNDMKEKLEDGTLELCAVLRQRRKYRGNDTDDANMGVSNKNGANHGNLTSKKSSLLVGGSGGISAGLLGLEYGGGALSPSLISRGLGSSERRIANAKKQIEMEDHYGTQIIRTKSLHIHTTLIPPIQLTVREVCGARAASGSTLVEITVEHSSKWHKEDVIVTGIAFHPGQSRLWGETSSIDAMIGNVDNQHGENESRTTTITSSSNNVNVMTEGKSMQGGELSVIDMSRRVRWGFAAGSAPELPLILGQYEAFATVIQIDAGEDVRSRAFLSPISVNAMIGDSEHIAGSTDVSNNENQEKSAGRGAERIMITADARWTSSRVGVENSDAFRVDMSLRGGLETATNQL